MADQAKIPLAQQLDAVTREIGMRQYVYPGRVTAKKMSQAKADHEVEAMIAVRETLKDYVAMQPKVLALASVGLALAKKLSMDHDAFDAMLVSAELEARERLACAMEAVKA